MIFPIYAIYVSQAIEEIRHFANPCDICIARHFLALFQSIATNTDDSLYCHFFLTVSRIFESKAKELLKRRSISFGRIWSVEVNGTGKGCGLIAADDKIRIWRQK